MKNFKLLPVSAAVLSVLAANAFAETVATDAAVLDTVTVTDNQGLKVQTNVVTTQKKEESTQTDLRGLLKDEPAISLGGGNGTSQYLYIRGMGQNSIDVKVDNTYSDSQILYHQGRHMLDPALVGTVTVQKGAGSASAGIGQTNGAVIAKTVDALDLLKNSDKNFGAKLGTGFSTNHAHNFNATLYGKGEIFDALVSGNLVRDRDYKGGKDYVNQFGTNRVPYSALDKSSFLAKLGATLGDHRFVLSHSNERNEGERLVREEFDAAPVGTKGSRVTLDRQAPANRRMTVQRTNLEWTGKNLGFAQEATANVYQLVQGRWSENETRNGYAGGVDYATKTKIVTHGANVNFDSALHENVLLKYGVNYRHQETKPYAKFSHQLVNQEKTDTGVYLEAITAPVDKVTLTTGVRYDHFKFKAMDGKKRSEGAFNPSVGIIYEPIQHLSFSASHNYATRSPRMHDALLSHGRRGVVSIANNTKSEQARSTEIGFNYNDGTFSFDGSYFWQNIKDALGTSTGRNNHLCPELTPNTNNKECYSEIINAGTIKNRGYELNAGYHNNGFTARVGVAHSKPRFQGDRLSTNPEYASAIGRTWTASLSYRFDQPNLEVGVHHRIIEKVKAEDNYFVMNNNGIPQFGRGGPTGKDGYNVTDITLNWKPLNDDSVNVNFAVDNVANKKYNAHGQRGQLSARGREFRAGVNYTF
ncbi:TonB-dependent receptor domain-containing protein [Mannheimia haemolytica]|uniref:TonB-dependent receptor domain-containing protein n=1 Tax=Mannheimia haemolytica TaxID=75985 RepID=UPI0001BCFD65|nr:TonB-dependent receptor [Mannheimia haemolytica]EEY13747.1 ferric enterobactin receptor [Mannheimia haemolytica serotype A2 str. BOVINE]TRC13627.1 TonB-dependent receptor [Mannheimia haemolytica]HDL3365328.1 TonB-dependent receptor [Mannheimia haemolytica]